jgi:hypothetical protein
MGSYPDSEESYARLHRAGWTVGEVRAGATWLVRGSNGENALRAEGASSDEAWHRAVRRVV